MFGLSSKTQVNRIFKLTDLYKQMRVTKQVKTDATNVLSISITNVLNTDTLNVVKNANDTEILVFVIELANKTVPSLFISALDKVFGFQTLFVLKYKEQSMAYVTYKECENKAIKVGKYYSTDWLNEFEISLPLSANDMSEIYMAILSSVIPIVPRNDEAAKEYVLRYETVLKLSREIDKLQRAVDNEKQSKKRFELNAELKELKKEFNCLK